MTKHCSTSPSARDRWNRHACPGSVNLIARLGVVSKSSPEASEGTDAHALAALCLINGQQALEFVDHNMVSGRTVAPEMAAAVQTYLDWVKTREGERYVEAKWERDFAIIDGGFGHVWGTSDLVIDDRFRRLSIVDYKHGAGVYVDVEDNLQLRMYAVLAAYSLDPDHNWEEVELVIVQPRFDSQAPVRTFTAPAGILREWADDLWKDVLVTQDPEAPLRPSETACRWCPAKPQCPARGAVVEAAVEAVGLVPPGQLGPEKLGWLLAHSKVIQDYLKDAYAYAMEQAEQGLHVPGHKLVESLGNRAWTDEAEAVRAFKRQKIKPDVYAPRKLLSPAQAEKLVDKAIVAGLTTRPISHKLVPESDKRPNLNVVPMDITAYLGD